MIADEFYCRNDSTGSWLAAFLAGMYPKMMPTVAETPKATSTDTKEMMVLMPAVFSIRKAIRIPKIMPMMPPEMLMSVDSDKN